MQVLCHFCGQWFQSQFTVQSLRYPLLGLPQPWGEPGTCAVPIIRIRGSSSQVLFSLRLPLPIGPLILVPLARKTGFLFHFSCLAFPSAPNCPPSKQNHERKEGKYGNSFHHFWQTGAPIPSSSAKRNGVTTEFCWGPSLAQSPRRKEKRRQETHAPSQCICFCSLCGVLRQLLLCFVQSFQE